jgi:hypothetical protein
MDEASDALPAGRRAHEVGELVAAFGAAAAPGRGLQAQAAPIGAGGWRVTEFLSWM